MLITTTALGLVGYYFREQIVHKGIEAVSYLGAVYQKWKSSKDTLTFKGPVALVDIV